MIQTVQSISCPSFKICLRVYRSNGQRRWDGVLKCALSSTTDSWATHVWATRVRSHADCFQPIRYSAVSVFSPPYDFLRNVFFTLGYFVVRIQLVIHMTYQICVHQFFMLLARLPFYSRLLTLRWWGNQKLYLSFRLRRPNPHVGLGVVTASSIPRCYGLLSYSLRFIETLPTLL